MKKANIIFVFSCLSVLSFSQKYELLSPDKKLKAGIEIGTTISVSLKQDNISLLKLDNISLETGNNQKQDDLLKVKRITRKSVDEIVRPEIREKAEAFINKYNELEISFKENQSLTFRLFDEGLAYRFSTSEKDSLIIFHENLNLYFDDKDSARFQSTPTFNSSYETPYEHMAVSEIEKGKLCSMPFLVRKANGTFIMISESDLYNYPGLRRKIL